MAGNFKHIVGTYHNHTTWSDGFHTPEGLVKKAIKLGFSEVGLTDHYYTLKGEVNCVTDENLDEYILMIKDLRELYHKEISVLAGLEIDTSAFNLYRSMLPFSKLNELDYVLFEYVDDTTEVWISQSPQIVTQMLVRDYIKTQKAGDSGKEPAEEEIARIYQYWEHRVPVFSLDKIVELRRNLSCEVGLAHPNMQNLVSKYGDINLARILGKNAIFIDVCGSARNSIPIMYRRHGKQRPFTLNVEGLGDAFKEAANKYGVKFVSSSDTHMDGATDSLQDTYNAIDTINEYSFEVQRFSKGSREPHR